MRSLVLGDALQARQIFVDPGPCSDAVKRFPSVVAEISRNSMSLAQASAANGDIDALVVDSYDVQLRESGGFVAVIDDFGVPQSGAAAIIAPGLAATAADYPTGTDIAAGPEFALINPMFAEVACHERGHQPRILISFGARDSKNLTSRAMRGVVQFVANADVTVVLGADAPHAAVVQASAAATGAGYYCDASPEQMARFLARTDVAIGAGGVSLLERFAAGVPSVVVCLAENQHRQIAAAFDRGAAVSAGSPGDADLEMRIGEAVAGLLADEQYRQAMIHAGKALVDGKGAGRAARFLNDAYRAWMARTE